MRYGLLLEADAVWQSQGAQAGELLYSVSLGPGDEVKLVMSDGRWRHPAHPRRVAALGAVPGATGECGGGGISS